MKLILLGYMGSGKTSIGKKLASFLKFSYMDLDEEIENREKCSVSELFSDKGELYFRKKESDVLYEILDSLNSLVLSTGGGTPCYGSNMEKLLSRDDVITIYLKTSLGTLTERLINEKSKRPLISHLNSKVELQEFIGKHLFERAPVYERAQIIIDTADMSVEEINAQIIAQLF